MRAPSELRIRLDQTSAVTALVYGADEPRVPASLILAHGAGAGQRSAFMTSFASALAARGVDTVTFNFLYTEQRRRIPDRRPALESCYRVVIEAIARELDSARLALFIGGKSMGGRIATHVAAAEWGEGVPAKRDRGAGAPGVNNVRGEGVPAKRDRGAGAPGVNNVRGEGVSGHPIAGIVLLGYPLHPPGRPDDRRDSHLPGVGSPMLFVQGSRDTFGTPGELAPVLSALTPPATLHVVAGGDHSFKVPKLEADAQAAVYDDVQRTIVEWMRSVLRPDLQK